MKKEHKHNDKHKTGDTHHKPETVAPDIDTEAMEPDEQQEAAEETHDVIDSHQKKYDELFDKYQRLMAEFDNFRKRTVKEKASMYDEGVKSVLTKLLPVVDNFERALAVTDDAEGKLRSDDSFYKGIEMILKQFNGMFDELGLEVIPAKNEKFDHNVHFAVAHVEDENYGENEIIDEMQKGYKYKDKVIRASMVRVAN